MIGTASGAHSAQAAGDSSKVDESLFINASESPVYNLFEGDLLKLDSTGYQRWHCKSANTASSILGPSKRNLQESICE